MIACYLVYEKKMSPKDAIELVRQKRPGSVQNRQQTHFVYRFENYLQGLTLTFPLAFNSKSLIFHSKEKMNLEDVLQRQSLYLHGNEQRKLKYIPKTVYELCQRIQLQSNVDSETVLNALLNYKFAELKRFTLWERLNHHDFTCIESLDLKDCIHLVLDSILSLDVLFVYFLISNLNRNPLFQKI